MRTRGPNGLVIMMEEALRQSQMLQTFKRTLSETISDVKSMVPRAAGACTHSSWQFPLDCCLRPFSPHEPSTWPHMHRRNEAWAMGLHLQRHLPLENKTSMEACALKKKRKTSTLSFGLHVIAPSFLQAIHPLHHSIHKAALSSPNATCERTPEAIR